MSIWLDHYPKDSQFGHTKTPQGWRKKKACDRARKFMIDECLKARQVLGLEKLMDLYYKSDIEIVIIHDLFEALYNSTIQQLTLKVNNANKR